MTTPIKPSEWIRQWVNANSPDSGDWPGGIMAYLDEYQDSVHPIARARMGRIELEPGDAGVLLARRFLRGTDEPMRIAAAPSDTADPAPTSSPGEDEPGDCGVMLLGYPDARCELESDHAGPHRIRLPDMREIDPDYPTYRDERDAARDELERVRAENADLRCKWVSLGQHDEALKKFTESERLVSELRAELAKRESELSGLRSKYDDMVAIADSRDSEIAKREAVVTAARNYLRYYEMVSGPSEDNSESLRQAVIALDKPQAEPVERAIVVGSTWARPVTVSEVVRVNDIDDRFVHYSIDGKHCGMDDRELFPINYTWVSDPPASEGEG